MTRIIAIFALCSLIAVAGQFLLTLALCASALGSWFWDMLNYHLPQLWRRWQFKKETNQ
jgi:hypothetical protein